MPPKKTPSKKTTDRKPTGKRPTSSKKKSSVRRSKPQAFSDKELRWPKGVEKVGAVYSNLEFVKCRFNNCAISFVGSPPADARSTVRNARIIDCEAASCWVGPAVLEDILIQNLRVTGLGLLIAGAPVFKHVTFEGKIGNIKINRPSTLEPADRAAAYTAANAEYYKSVDWALDISKAECGDMELGGIPARLIRRDPETQVIVTRERARAVDWKKLDLSKTHWDIALEWFIDSGDADEVLVAPKRDRKFKDHLAGLNLLRSAGVAEPD